MAFRRLYVPPSWCAIGLAVGLLAGIAQFRWSFIWLLVLLGAGAVLMSFRLRAIILLGCLGIGLLLGNSRAQTTRRGLDEFRPYINEKVVLSGVVIDEPSYSDKGQLEAYIGNARVHSVAIPGKIRLRGFGGMSRGDQIFAEGTLRDGFGSYQAAMYYAQIQKVGVNNSIPTRLRTSFQQALTRVLSEPHASFGFGLLAGARSSLPDDFEEALSNTGLTHIVAVSGYNLTILILVCRRFFGKISPRIGVVAALALVAGFLLVTGFSASIVRAAIVATLSLAAWYYGRSPKPVALIFLTAAITAAINPLYVWSDIGWCLSFAAFFGVLVFAPAITARMPGREPSIPIQVLIESLCAYIMTAPIIMLVFGRVSIIGPIANLLILPFIPIAMLLVFIAGLVGMTNMFMLAWLALPAQLLIGLIVRLIRTCAAVEWSTTTLSLSGMQAASIYLGIFLVSGMLWHKQRSRRDILLK